MDIEVEVVALRGDTGTCTVARRKSDDATPHSRVHVLGSATIKIRTKTASFPKYHV